MGWPALYSRKEEQELAIDKNVGISVSVWDVLNSLEIFLELQQCFAEA